MTDRNQLIDLCFQRGPFLNTDEATYRDTLTEFLRWLTTSDGVDRDLTTRTLGLSHDYSSMIVAKQSGVIAGLQEALFLLDQDTRLVVEPICQDGATVEKGQTLLTIAGSIVDLLRYERTVLNLIGRMSGIATQAAQMVKIAGDGVKVAATRKTPWMFLDKRAVFCGGALTHRLNLSDSILVKDNHLEALKRQMGSAQREDAVRRTVELALASSLDFFEVEVESASQAAAAISTFAQRDAARNSVMVVMLDNFGPDDAAAIVREAKTLPIYPLVLFEASGDITEATLPRWATTGVDVVSMGALTHTAKNFNVSMAM